MPTPIDILMITYNRPEYVRRALPRLLETCDADMRVWLWHNGDHEETLAAVREHADHPQIAHFEHSRQNLKLREPTNWFWQSATAPLLSKVDDDCLMPDDWGESLRRLHHDIPKLGLAGCWPWLETDFDARIAAPKIRTFAPGHKLMLNCWLGGSGYALKREAQQAAGPLREDQSFTNWCIRRAREGWIIGWPVPLLLMEHMDDPRSPHCRFQTEQEFQRMRGLSAEMRGIDSLDAFRKRQHEAALELLRASPDPRDHIGWRVKWRRIMARLAHFAIPKSV